MKHLFMYLVFFLLIASFGFNVYFFQGLSSSTPYIFNINSESEDFVVHDLVYTASKDFKYQARSAGYIEVKNTSILENAQKYSISYLFEGENKKSFVYQSNGENIEELKIFNLGKSITTRNSDRFNFVTEPKDYNDLIEKLNKMTISITVGYKNGDVKTYDVPLVIKDLKI